MYISSIHSFNYGSFFTRPCLSVTIQRKTEQDLNKFQIFKPDYSSCARGSSSSEFTKRVVRKCLTKNQVPSTKSRFHITLMQGTFSLFF